MRQLTSIVAVNRDGVIGCRNALPWRVRSDMVFFKEQTRGNVVIMGRKTYDSLGRCLPDRYNVVLTRQFQLFADERGCVSRAGVSEGLLEAYSTPQKFREIFVIGGATMYEQFDQLVDRYLITIVDKDVSNADAFFDMSIFDRTADWTCKQVAEKAQGEGDEAPFEIFELTSKHLESRQGERVDRLSALAEKTKRSVGSSRRSHTVRDSVPSPAFL